MYAGIRQAKAKAGMAAELTRRIKEGAIPIISDVPGFQAYYVIYGADDTVTAPPSAFSTMPRRRRNPTSERSLGSTRNWRRFLPVPQPQSLGR